MKKIDMNCNDFTKEQIIDLRKQLNKQTKDARAKSKHNACLLCGRQGGFCDSHTIPKFCLENIAWNGQLNSFFSLINTELFPMNSGIGNAGIFREICRSCDGKVFQDYEQANAYDVSPSEKILNQIALKNSLRDIYKHETEIEMFEGMKRKLKENSQVPSFMVDLVINKQIEARKMDLQECYDVLNKAKEYLVSATHWLNLISFDKLNYTVPIAFQGMVALITGVNSETINNIFTRKKKYKIQYLHIAVFPLNNETVVITFQEKNNNRYQVFERFLKETTLEKRMEIINRILFLYTEDYYLSKQLDADIIKSLEESAQTIQDTFTISPKRSLINAIKDYDLRRDTCIPNLLSKGYAVNKVE